MNIFYLDHDVKKCAQYHVDKHCVKMILEYAQLLSTAHRVLDGEKVITYETSIKTGKLRKKTRWKLIDENFDNAYYSATHINHPSAIWVRDSVQNYILLYDILCHLCEEYTHRYEKLHKIETSGLLTRLQKKPKNINYMKPRTFPTQAMPDEYKNPDTIVAYRNYYNGAKRHLHSWKNREIPHWIT